MTKIEISHKTIIFTVAFLISLYLLFLIKDIILGIFIAIMLMTALNPIVNRLVKLKIPRLFSIWIVFLLTIGTIFGLLALIIPPLVSQTISLIEYLPLTQVTETIQSIELNLENVQVISQQLTSLPKIITVFTSTFSALIAIVTLLVMTFYLLVERHQLHHHLHWFFGNNQAEIQAQNFVDKVEEQVGHWVRGEIILMVIIGVMTYIGLIILNVPYALPLAIIAGILEILPNIGPTISAIPAIIVAYIATTPTIAIATTVLYILIQQIENTFIVPQIMKSAVGISPIITIIILLVGYRLGGVGGAALGIPIFLVVKVIVTEFYHLRYSSKQKV